MEVLALIEHVDRELDLLCLLKVLLRKRHGITLRLANVYADAPLLLAGPVPRLVLTPFFYSTSDLVVKDYVTRWPETRFVNLAWEQLLYPIHQTIKIPRDDFTRNEVQHFAWTQQFADYLHGHGVPRDRVTLTGHALYRLYHAPYHCYFRSRSDLARDYGLDENRQWIFVAENYRWAFLTDAELLGLTRNGVEAEDLSELRDYCRTSLSALVKWCAKLARQKDVEVVIRPRPATSVRETSAFLRDVSGLESAAFHIIKGESAREWVMASDVVTSSFSTVLIEGALAGKRVLRVEPEPIPAGLHYDWCDLVPSAKTEEEFVAACSRSSELEEATVLREWAEATFSPAGDPIDQLVAAVAEEARKANRAGSLTARGELTMRMPLWLKTIAPYLPPVMRHWISQVFVRRYPFHRKTHEKDLFGRKEIDQRSLRWRCCVEAARGTTPLEPVQDPSGSE